MNSALSTSSNTKHSYSFDPESIFLLNQYLYKNIKLISPKLRYKIFKKAPYNFITFYNFYQNNYLNNERRALKLDSQDLMGSFELFCSIDFFIGTLVSKTISIDRIPRPQSTS